MALDACSDCVNEDLAATGDVACFLNCTFSSIIEHALHRKKKKRSSVLKSDSALRRIK